MPDQMMSDVVSLTVVFLPASGCAQLMLGPSCSWKGMWEGAGGSGTYNIYGGKDMATLLVAPCYTHCTPLSRYRSAPNQDIKLLLLRPAGAETHELVDNSMRAFSRNFASRCAAGHGKPCWPVLGQVREDGRHTETASCMSDRVILGYTWTSRGESKVGKVAKVVEEGLAGSHQQQLTIHIN